MVGYAQKPSDTPASQMEKLDRGLVVTKYSSGKSVKYFASWRLLGTLLDGATISKYGGSALGVGSSSITGQSNNGTKATPNLSADIFGDWREELILRSPNNDALNIFTTIIPTDYRVPTLMHDHVYRMGIAWQNVAYNQPPHLGYYLPDYIESFQGVEPTGIHEVEMMDVYDGTVYNLMGVPVNNPTKGIYITNGKKVYVK